MRWSTLESVGELGNSVGGLGIFQGVRFEGGGGGCILWISRSALCD